MRRLVLRSIYLALLLLLSDDLSGQDTRQVNEPRLPRPCSTLDAAIETNLGEIPIQNEQALDTMRIQSAIDHCAPGQAVVLRARGKKKVFLTGPLSMRSNVTLRVDAGTALVASRDPRVYDLTPGSCGIVSERGHGCRPLISGDDINNSGIMGNGSIDGRGGAKLLGQSVTWWDLAHQAKVRDQQQSVPWLIVLHHVKNFTLYNITLRNSSGFHVAVNQADGFTAWGVKIIAPKTARNTDGIDPSSSRNVTITNCFIHTGDDNVAIKSSKAGSSSNISVAHNHFYTGHGLSIGSGTSGGIDHLLVDDLTIDGADNGIRIKSDRSRGGLVRDILYRDVCIRDVKNPLVFTPFYTTFAGDQLPVYRGIALKDVHILTAGNYTFLGLDADHKLGLTLDNVFAGDQQHSNFLSKDSEITVGNRRGDLTPHGEDVTLNETEASSPGMPVDCDKRFVGFPNTDNAPEMAGTIPSEDKTFYVAADGTGDYYSIQSAIEAAPSSGGAQILVAPGVYREVLTINKPDIHLLSADRDASKTVVVNDRSAGANGGTLHSATVNVTTDNFFAENITFENDFNRTHPQLPAGSQALALLVTGDRAIFHNVRLLGNQDTVYAGSRNCFPDGTDCVPARQYFSDCYIAGNVDFIFGDGKAVFSNCEIHSTPHNGGFVTAQAKHYAEEDSGFVFEHCNLTADKDVNGKVYLGRPWRPFASVAFLNTEMDDQIDAAGWREWHPGETHSLDTAFYAEYNSTGPGAHPGERDPHTRLLTPAEARMFEPAVYLRGSDQWNPIALLASAEASEQAQTDAQTPRIDGIAHIALRVSDLDRERKFLQSLGFAEAFAQTSGTSTSEAFFKINDRQFIELYPRRAETNVLGLMHICYESGSLEQLNALYVARGLPISPVRKGGAGNLMSSLHDPFGQEIEFTQYLPGSRHFEDRGKHLGASRISGALRGIELPVSDLDQAEKFYTAKLGFEVRKESGAVRLHVSSDADQWIGLDALGAGTRPHFVLKVANIKQTRDQLRRIGLRFNLHNHAVSIADPDGNIFVLSEDSANLKANHSVSMH